MENKTDKLIELKKMLDKKLITQEEFEKMKNELLEVHKKIYDNSSNINKKEHWIKSTKLAIFCNKNEFTRKITAQIIVLICLLFFINCIHSLSEITSNTNIYQVTQSTQAYKKINNYKIQILVSVIGLIGTFYYGNKLLDKKDIDNKVNNNTSKQNNSKSLIYWNKGIVTSIVIFILSVLLKIFTNGFWWKFATFTFFTSIILFVASMIRGWYVMHTKKQKWPIWYSIIIVMIIIALVFAMINSFYDIRCKRYTKK